MLPSEETEAERMFWRLPELVETLLSYLDVKSIFCLAQCHQLTLKLLQGTSDWNKIIKRSCPEGLKIVRYHQIRNHSIRYQDNFLGLRKRLAPEILQMAYLVGLLKMVENPEAHLCALLELVCERFPPHQNGHKLLYNDGNFLWGGDGRTKLGTPNIDLNSLFGSREFCELGEMRICGKSGKTFGLWVHWTLIQPAPTAGGAVPTLSGSTVGRKSGCAFWIF